MIVTLEGVRIFIQFEEEISESYLFKDKIEELGLQNDLIISKHLTDDWKISAIIPNFLNDANLHNELVAKDISRNFFSQHPMQNASVALGLNSKQPVDYVYCDNLKNLIIYTLRSNDLNPNWLKMCFMRKNDAQYGLVKRDYFNLDTFNLEGCITQDYSIAMIGETRKR